MSARVWVAAAWLAIVGQTSLAATDTATWRNIPWNAASGSHDGNGEQTHIAWTTDVQVEAAALVRVFFADVNLGQNSYVLLRATNGDLRLNAASMKEYFDSSCILSGEHIAIELHVAPKDRGVSIRIDRVMTATPGPEIATLCSSDDRVASTDNRVARLVRTSGMSQIPYCSAWRISNGAFLTAGHCADFDPDGSGPQLPDGTMDMNGLVEFNVPASSETGGLNAALVNDQYPIDLTSVQWRFDGEGQGLGKDWCVFRVNKNANTGLLPHEVYGPPFRVTRELPEVDETMRVTGFGTDTGTANQTNQTSTGTFEGEVVSGQDIELDHRVDTTGASSGSPFIWESMNLAFGIHTTGGCDNNANSSNTGTSFEVDALEMAINNSPGSNTRYADALHPLRVAEEGTLFRPYASLVSAINATPNNGVCSIYIGVYGVPSGTTFTRAMTLQAPAGGVFILGN